ncbi:helix-turn-helix transcriptional regulator [Streptomyces poonensis]|uniref:HTH araC/xylS-type domain-containing protein n=1 Tax=Streptomyces poonensis TaxID=68255 RepID=A0A918UQY0_9ACTN|nr:helix-turn-helix transcriptional regulator [Streptomyces poonensis]GGZ27306.1 hypothetical protein GCM10010365_54390 [Streptomyces poonensis]GLJ93830.1 hypothetical protein GCM10017589_64470 [Streptomyces poonensis]
MDTLVFDSEDLELTEDFLSKVYTKMRIGSDAEHARAQISRNVMGSVSVDQLDFAYDVAYDADSLSTICVGSVQSGTIVRQYFPHKHGTEGVFGPDDVFVFAPLGRPYGGAVHRSRYNVTMLDPVLLSQVAAALPGRRPEPVRLTGDRPVSPTAAGHLLHTITHLREHVLAVPAIRETPLVVSTASQHLAASVLNAFPNTALTDPTIEDRNDAHAATVRRAVAFIDDHADTAISLADIAAAACVSIRTVQCAFRRHLDTTPMGYLRRVRLAQAHAELLAADPTTGVTVAAIAARWGFFNPGRFSVTYRTAYGSSPYRTLRRDAP